MDVAKEVTIEAVEVVLLKVLNPRESLKEEVKIEMKADLNKETMIKETEEKENQIVDKTVNMMLMVKEPTVNQLIEVLDKTTKLIDLMVFMVETMVNP